MDVFPSEDDWEGVVQLAVEQGVHQEVKHFAKPYPSCPQWYSVKESGWSW